MPKLLIIVSFLFPFISAAQTGLGEVIGEVVDYNGEPQGFAHVFFDDVFGQRYQARTDEEGRFRISMVPVGEYMLNVRLYGDTLKNVPVEVPRDGFYNCGKIEFEPFVHICICPPPRYFPMINRFFFEHTKIEREDFKINANRFELQELAGRTFSEIQSGESESLYVKGGKPESMLILVDGVKMREVPTLPSAGVQSLTIDTGGIPAKFGDTTGGVIEIETKSYFDLYREWQANQLKRGY